MFVSHGHDEKAKTNVKSFLESCGLEPIILADQPSGGRAILEKFEAYGDVGFAIVLLTADDLGPSQIRIRYRHSGAGAPNVIMELGYFMAKLGRGRVCVLLQTGVEIPSNILGIVTIGYSDDSKWQDQLTRELKYAGLKLRS